MEFRRPKKCDTSACVEVAIAPPGINAVAVRNPQPWNGHRTVTFTKDEWRLFVDAVKACEFDVPDEAQR